VWGSWQLFCRWYILTKRSGYIQCQCLAVKENGTLPSSVSHHVTTRLGVDTSQRTTIVFTTIRTYFKSQPVYWRLPHGTAPLQDTQIEVNLCSTMQITRMCFLSVRPPHSSSTWLSPHQVPTLPLPAYVCWTLLSVTMKTTGHNRPSYKIQWAAHNSLTGLISEADSPSAGVHFMELSTGPLPWLRFFSLLTLFALSIIMIGFFCASSLCSFSSILPD
jgi:hypothetical protein